jgi:hypothetical protein
MPRGCGLDTYPGQPMRNSVVEVASNPSTLSQTRDLTLLIRGVSAARQIPAEDERQRINDRRQRGNRLAEIRVSTDREHGEKRSRCLPGRSTPESPLPNARRRGPRTGEQLA